VQNLIHVDYILALEWNVNRC